MKLRIARRGRPQVPVAAGERLLSWARTEDKMVLGGTRDALYLGEVRIPWEQVQSAEWDADSSELRVVEVGSWGEVRPDRVLTVAEPVRLLELIRERVSSTVVLQRHVSIHGRRGVRVIGRRATSGEREITWVYEFDEGVDPEDPEVRRRAEAALAIAQEEVGDL